MTRTRSIWFCALLLAVSACSSVTPRQRQALDCSVGDPYEFRNISNFDGGQTGWFLFADPTPHGVPDPQVDSNLEVTEVAPPGRCGDTGMVELKAYGHNFYGTGYGDYATNSTSDRAIGTDFEGISFWARAEPDSDKTFMLYVDDENTLLLPPAAPDGGGLPTPATGDQDLDGDGFIGPGDIVNGTTCRLPPPQSLGAPACYYGGALPPATATRVPDAHECGNQFHEYVTVTDDWQLFLIPFGELRQWPCPNQSPDGLDVSDIAELEIKFLQGTNYDIWLDNIAFYRPRADGGI